jgi:calcium/calmodulin-dependent protein kinase I
MHKFFTLFRKDNEITYPIELENSYKVLKKNIGVGSFAVVKECINKKTGESYALKILTKKSIKGNYIMFFFSDFFLFVFKKYLSISLGRENLLDTELGVLKKVDHPNIVKLENLYESKEGVFIVTELASGGELFNQLLLKGSYTERDAANLVKQILEGVAYLHDHEVKLMSNSCDLT